MSLVMLFAATVIPLPPIFTVCALPAAVVSAPTVSGADELTKIFPFAPAPLWHVHPKARTSGGV